MMQLLVHVSGDGLCLLGWTGCLSGEPAVGFMGGRHIEWEKCSRDGGDEIPPSTGDLVAVWGGG